MTEMKESGIEWIGKIPKDWGLIPFGYLLLERSENNNTVKTDERLSLSIDKGVTLFAEKTTNLDRYKDDVSQYKITHVGDFVMNSMNMIVGAVGISNYFGCVSPAYYTFYDNEDDSCYCKYCDYLFHTQALKQVLFSLGKGIMAIDKGEGRVNTCRLKVSRYDLKKIILPLPSQTEIRKIIKFLDKKCAEIDTLYIDIQKQIEILEEYKKSIITEAVTKGLDPDVEMKDSGIEWIGMIPKDWSTIRIGHVFSLRNERNSLPEDQVQLLSLYTGIGVFPQGEHVTASGNHAQTVDGYKIVHKNDIVVNIILAWMGAIGVSDYDGVTSPAYDIYIPDLSKVVPHYFHYVFRTTGIAGECYKYGRGIMMMRWRTYSQEFKQIFVPFPSLEKQQEIAEYLDKKCAEIDGAIEEKKQQLETLEQYKKSVIYEYVTGKKEVQ